ncbi:Glutathione S-transferase zeta class [Vitis vinifera]|uniref:Glutathione S-transferase zeta class n=1 Tax=Vitis vinifera TaxID=29760 RepID=A0A438JA35_VITVI|nr:Glutathione S-transferase zeta class [Vitis vinifera]
MMSWLYYGLVGVLSETEALEINTHQVEWDQLLFSLGCLNARGELGDAANIVSANIQPFQNLVVLKYIEEKCGSGEELAWVKHHIEKGFAALEKLLKDHAGKYATGDEVFLADLFLAPQIHAALKWFKVDMTEFPLSLRLNDAYNELPAFQDAMKEKQPDYVPS